MIYRLPLFIFYFHRNTEELHIISFFWPLCSFIIDFLHQLILMAALDQWVQPSSFKGSQGLFVVLTNYWSNLFSIRLLVLERLFCVRWIYLHCVCHQEAPYIPNNDFQGSMQSLEFYIDHMLNKILITFATGKVHSSWRCETVHSYHKDQRGFTCQK